MARNLHGFTIFELMVSSIIIIFIFTATISTYIMLDKIWHEDLVLNDLMRSANIALEYIIRGVHGNEGLEAARAVTAPLEGLSSDTVQYTDYNNTSRSFYYSNNSIYASGGKLILANVVSAAFYNVDNTILQIDLVTHKYVVNKEIKFHLQTKVKRRN